MITSRRREDDVLRMTTVLVKGLVSVLAESDVVHAACVVVEASAKLVA